MKQPKCLETAVQAEMQRLCKKWGIEFNKQYYIENKDLYTTYIISKLNTKAIATTIININNLHIKQN